MSDLTNDRPAIRIVIERMTVIRCQAPHPLARKVDRWRGQKHNTVLDKFPFMAKPTGNVLESEPEVNGYYYPYCEKCKRFSEYEIISPESLPAEAA